MSGSSVNSFSLVSFFILDSISLVLCGEGKHFLNWTANCLKQWKCWPGDSRRVVFFISRTFVIRTDLEVRLHILQADCAVQTGVRVRWYQHTFPWSTLYPVKLFSTQLLPPVSMHIWLYYYVPLITITARRAFKKQKNKKTTINIGKIFAACKSSDSFPVKYQRGFYPQKSSKLLMLFSLLGLLDWILLTVCILYIFWAKRALKGKIILDIILRRPIGGRGPVIQMNHWEIGCVTLNI